MIPSKQITLGYVISGGGWVLFALGFFGMLGENLTPRETEHAYIFFRNVGWLVTCGWLLQFWETSTHIFGIRRRLSVLLGMAKEHIIPVLVSPVLVGVLLVIWLAFFLLVSTATK